jgi:autotransporter-associated beta strand protein
VLPLLSPGPAARAACTPALTGFEVNVTAICTGTTNSQNGFGYGTGNQTNLSVTVTSGSSVAGATFGIFGDVGLVVTNSGTIVGFTSQDYGVRGGDGTTVTNNSGASILGDDGGVTVAGNVNVTNSGLIQGIGGGGFGIKATGDATVINDTQGTIRGVSYGVWALGNATVTNSGTIDGASAHGISADTATVTNNAGGSISAGQVGVATTGAANVTNYGTIIGDFGIISSTGSTVFNAGTITGGTLAIAFSGSGNTLTLGPGSVINGTVIGAGSDTFQLGGTGSDNFDVSRIGAGQQYQGFTTFNKIDSSTWRLTGSGAQTWTISGGRLIGNTTSIQGSAITNNAALEFDQATNGTYAGVISGAGSLTKSGAGTVTLTGVNTYGGGTEVNAGTLAIGGTGTLGAVSGATTVNTGGTLDLGGTTQTQNGGLTMAGGTIGNGILRSSGTFSMFGGMVNAVLAGTGNLIATSGNTRLTANNTYSGATTVNGGRLEVTSSGSIVSNVTVNGGSFINNGTSSGSMTMNGGTVGGNGSYGSTTLNGGTLSPGNSIGTVTFNGNLALTSASTYLVEIDANGSDRTNVTGTATLGGATVSAVYAQGSYITRRYTILNATGGVSGTFSTLVNTNLPTNFTSQLSYDANNAYLTLTLNFTPTNNNNPTPTDNSPTPNLSPNFGGRLNFNQASVATALIRSFNTAGGIPLAFGALTPQGLTIVSGEAAIGTQQTTFDAMGQFTTMLTNPFLGTRGGAGPQAGASGYADENDTLAYASRRKGRNPVEQDAYAAMSRKASLRKLMDPRWSVWGAGYGGTQSTDGNAAAGTAQTSSRVYGGAAGFDYRLTPDTLIGFALGGAGTRYNLANGLGGGSSEMFQAGIYGRHTIGAAYIAGALAYGWQDVTTDRNVFLNQYRARFDANALTGRLETGYRFAFATSGLTPYAAGQFTTNWLPNYAEQVVAGTNLFALSYVEKDVTASRSELGLRGDTTFATQDAIVTLRGRAAWAHNFDTNRSVSTLFQTLPASSFVVNGASPAHNSALVSAGAEARWMNGFSVAATVEGEFSSLTGSYAGKGVVRYQW